MSKRRLFVDMDGVLAEFQLVATERLYEKNYFLNLRPQMNVVRAVQRIIQDGSADVFVLSAVLKDSRYALDEKNQWLDEHLPEIDQKHRVFVGYGTDKKAAVPCGVWKNDFLLDDYTKNLLEWSPPGSGIKLLNGINHTKGTWRGDKVSKHTDALTLATQIEHIIAGPPIRDRVRNGGFER